MSQMQQPEKVNHSFPELFAPVEKLPTSLAYRRILSPTCGLRVSPLCLGAMSLGAQWGKAVGEITKEQAFELLDAFYAKGGNFIDTANLYHYGDSEEWLGEWMESRGNRDEMVIATKYSGYSDGTRKDANSSGNHLKSMHLSVQRSLKRLRTTYIDILYIHFWEHTTPVDEVMRGLNRFILAGQVLYPAVSDTPAWIVVKANCYAREKGLAPFVLYQGKWNLGDRDMEREIIPMCRSEGMAICPWSAIGGGKWASKAQMEERRTSGEKLRGEVTEKDQKISEALEKVGDKHGASVTAVALAWIMQTTPYVFPMIGGRKVSHLEDNIKALDISLSEEEIKELEATTPFDIGFPLSMVGQDPHWKGGPGGVNLPATAKFQWVQNFNPIKPEEQAKQ